MKKLSKALQRKRGSTSICGVALGVMLCMSTPAYCLSYSASPISAFVIDEETRQPLVGAIALIIWELQNSDGGGGGYWIFEEAVSDKQGRFSFPGWGPKVVPQKRGEPQWRLGPDQPSIYIFKSGYPLGTVFNPWESWMLGNRKWTGDPTRSSIWNGKTIELRKFQGTEQEYLAALSRRAGHLPLQSCRWSQIPQFTAALVRERGDRIKFPAFSSLPTIQTLSEDASDAAGCRPPIEVLGRYLK